MRQGDAMSDKYRKGRITFLVNSGNIALKSAASLAAIAIVWDFVTELRAGFNMPFMLALGSVALAVVSLWFYIKAVWLARKN